MQTHKEEFELGSVEYRLPNHIEKMRLIAKMGFKKPGDDSLEDMNFYDSLASVMEFLPQVVLKVECKKGEQELSWDDLMNEESFLPVVQRMALSVFTGSFQKKD